VQVRILSGKNGGEGCTHREPDDAYSTVSLLELRELEPRYFEPVVATLYNERLH
jgi:hypothetical protein